MTTPESPLARAVNSVMTFSSDGSLMASGAFTREVGVWDVETGEELTELSIVKPVTNLAFSPDGHFLAAGLGDPYGNYSGPNLVYIWRVADVLSGSSEASQVLGGHSESVTGLTFSPDSRFLVSSSWDGTVRVWDIAENRWSRILRDGENETGFSSVAFSPDGTQLITGNTDGSLRLWDVATGNELFRVVEHGYPVQALAFTPDSRNLLTANEQYLDRWEIETGQLISRQAFFHYSYNPGYRVRVFSPDAALLVGQTTDNRVLVWAINEPQLRGLSNFVLPIPASYTPWISEITTSPGGQAIAVLRFQDIRLINIYTGDVQVFSPSPTDAFYDLVWSPDQRLLAVSVRNLYNVEQPHIELFDLLEGEAPSFSVVENADNLAFSPEGRLLVYSTPDITRLSGDTIHIQELDTGIELFALQRGEGTLTDLTFDSSGDLLAASSDKFAVQLWDTNTGDLLATLQHNDYYIWRKVVFSADNKLMASTGGNGTIYLWGVPTDMND